jgi:CheY-like chemotaxis protein
MPEMNGLEATQAIRKLEKASGGHVPIIGLTAHALKGDRDMCIEAGMDDYVPKPISVSKLQETIANHLGPAPEKQTA